MSPTDLSPNVEQKVAGEMRILMELQSLDDKLAALKGQKSVGPASLKRKQTELEQGRKLVDEKHHQTQEAQKQCDKKELDIKSCEEHIHKLESQRISVRKNEEYKALTESIEHEGDRCSRLEEETLVFLTKIDEYKAEHEQLEQERNRIKSELEALKAKVQAETERIDQEIAVVSRERNDTAGKIPSPVFERYERIRNGRGGKAVVAVLNGVCQGCSMGVTDQTVNRLILRKELVFCENCSRMLYLSEDSIAELVKGPQQE